MHLQFQFKVIQFQLVAVDLQLVVKEYKGLMDQVHQHLVLRQLVAEEEDREQTRHQILDDPADLAEAEEAKAERNPADLVINLP